MTEVTLESLAQHIAERVVWAVDEDLQALGRTCLDADWVRGYMTADPSAQQPGRYHWTAWGYGSPCPEGYAPTLTSAKIAACYAMAKSMIEAMADCGLAILVKP